MKKLVFSLVRQYLFWMIFFLILRALFLLFYFPILKSEQIPWNEVLATFWHALYLDTATSCYILIIPLFILTLQGLFTVRALDYVNKAYTYVILFISTLIGVAELGIYGEWKTKLTGKALSYLDHPVELYRSVSGAQFFGFLAALTFFTGLGVFLFNRVFFVKGITRLKHRLWVPVYFLTGTALLVIGLRGGLGPIPITSGVSYFSGHSILNWAAVNSNYNLAVSYLEGQKFHDTNPFDFYPMEEAENTLAELNAVPEDTTINILKVPKPNIVILLMESWSADLVESLGGEPGITPEFRKLEKEGLLFTQFYASGNRSQQGLASILCGYPAIPYTTITENPSKYQKLPSLTKLLMDKGYRTSFYFGGDLNYGNIRAFLIFNQFQEIIEETDIPDTLPRGRLGIHDEYMMHLFADRLERKQGPFFSMLFTLSSHSPYDQPKEHSLDWQGLERDYVNSAYYADYSLGQFFKEVKGTPWYDSTLFIIIADHSHNTYRDWPIESFNYRKIPLMLLGGALKDEFRGMQDSLLFSNMDLPKTILNQLGFESSAFSWSRDMFNPYSPHYAYFEINDGVGYKNPHGQFVYNVHEDRYLYMHMNPGTTEADREALIRQGKSYIEVLFQTFIDM